MGPGFESLTAYRSEESYSFLHFFLRKIHAQKTGQRQIWLNVKSWGVRINVLYLLSRNFTTMKLDGYSLLLPEGTLNYFDVINVVEDSTQIVIYLEEKKSCSWWIQGPGDRKQGLLWACGGTRLSHTWSRGFSQCPPSPLDNKAWWAIHIPQLAVGCFRYLYDAWIRVFFKRNM